jgi:hypothetical protein
MVTKDYSKFTFSENNREIKQSSVEKLKASMKEHGFIAGRPVLITKDGVIVDGQHRFIAAKELGIEIHYEIIDGDYMKKMIELNSTQTNWTLTDYIKSYASLHVDCYRKLLKFQEKYNLGMSTTIALCIDNKIKTSDIRLGKLFVMNPYAEDIAEYVLNCTSIPYNKDYKFIQAVNNVYKKLNRSELAKLKTNLISVPQLSKSADYVIAFENILNKGKHGQNRVKLT